MEYQVKSLRTLVENTTCDPWCIFTFALWCVLNSQPKYGTAWTSGQAYMWRTCGVHVVYMCGQFITYLVAVYMYMYNGNGNYLLHNLHD